MNVFLCRGEYEETIVKETVLKLAAKMFWCFELGLGAFMMSESGRDFVYSYFNDQLWSPIFLFPMYKELFLKLKKCKLLLLLFTVMKVSGTRFAEKGEHNVSNVFG